MERAEGEKEGITEIRLNIQAVPDGIDPDDDDDSVSDELPTSPSLIRGYSRSGRFTSSYKGMFRDKPTIGADDELLDTMDNRSSTFSFSSASNYYAITSYLTEEEIVENIHPCTFISKV